MDNDNLTSSPQERRLRRKTSCLSQRKESSRCKGSPSDIKSEQKKVIASPSFSLKHKQNGKAKDEKSPKQALRTAVDSHSPLSNLASGENVVPLMQQRVFPRRSQRLSLIAYNDLAKFSPGKKAAERSCKLLNDKKSMYGSSEDVNKLFGSISLVSRNSLSTDANRIVCNELGNDSTTDVAFSPICSGQDSVADDLKNDVADIIETLVEEGNENEKSSSVEQKNKNESPSNNEECSAMRNILKGVVAYVEVRSGHENRTKAIERQLHHMGAKIVPKFLSTTTHVIFKEGRRSTRDKAVARNLPLVSVLWVESCKQQRHHVPEAEFPANIPEIYDSPVPCRRIRKLKSMQPKDFNVEFAGSIERLNKIFSRIRQDNEYYSTSDSFCGSETSASIKGDDTASDDNVDYTPHSSKKPVPIRKLFDLSLVESKIIQLEDKKGDEIATSSKHHKRNRDCSTVATEATEFPIKRRKLLSDLNQSPRPLATVSDNYVKRKIKSNSTPRRNKSHVGTSVKLSTNAKNKNKKTEINHCNNSSISAMTDKGSQHNDEKDIIDSNMLINLKENSRNSLDDFEDKKHRKEKLHKKTCCIGDSFDSDTVSNTTSNTSLVEKSTVVLTSLQSTDREVICSIIEALGGFQIKCSVTEITTHVISGDNRRTLNILFGLVRGCWILSLQWVYKSMEAGHWLEEEPFQLSEYSSSSKVSCLERANHGSGYCQNLFGQLGNIFVSSECIPSCENLIELIRLAGGKVSNCRRKCIVLIGPLSQTRRESKIGSHVVHLSEKWILDCISQHKTLPFDDYKI